MTPNATAAKTTRETQREVEPADIGELVTDSASNHTATTSGNPY